MRQVNLNRLVSEPLSHDASSGKQVAFRDGEIPHITQLARARIPPGVRLAPHAHRDMHEVFIVLAGRGLLHCGGDAHAAAPGGCIRVGPGEVHAFENTGDEDLVVLYFGVAE